MRSFNALLLLCGLLSASAANAARVIDLDYACFRGDSASTFVEFYASVQRDGLQYRQDGDSLRADFSLILSILRHDTLIVADTFSATDWASTIDSMRAGQFFPHVFQYFMKPGDYDVRASLFQYRAVPEEVVSRTAKIQALSGDRLQLSGIQLGSEMSVTEEESSFAKNGYQIMPNPTRFYGTQLPLFYFYLEAYGLKYDGSEGDSLALLRTVYRADQNVPVRPENRKIYQKSGSSAVLTDGFPIYTLPTGTYQLVVTVVDYADGSSATAEKNFFCYRPDDFAYGRTPIVDDSVKAQMLYSNIDILEIIEPDSALRLMHYLFDSRKEEKRILDYNEEAKREYLRQYWSAREREEPGAANKYFARVATANGRFGYLNKHGWRTDRGRVLIMYGEPDQIIHRYQEASIPDHEVWQYERIEGGVEFIFMDRSGFGDMSLVHSTKNGELKNPNWVNDSPTSTGDGSGARLR